MEKRQMAVFAAMALVLAISAPLAAQETRVTANIPFEFRVGGKTLPAGEYAIRNSSNQQALLINSLDHPAAALVLAATNSNSQRDGASAVLTFNRYGESYFLSRVRNGAAGTESVLPVTSPERELSRTASLQKFEILAVVASR